MIVKKIKINNEKSNIVLEKAKNNKNEFLDFLKNYNVLELAIGIAVGGAAKDLVASIVNDMIMPIVGIFSPSGSWREMVFTIAGSDFKIGNLMGACLNFFIVAIVVFVLIQKILKVDAKKKS